MNHQSNQKEMVCRTDVEVTGSCTTDYMWGCTIVVSNIGTSVTVNSVLQLLHVIPEFVTEVCQYRIQCILFDWFIDWLVDSRTDNDVSHLTSHNTAVVVVFTQKRRRKKIDTDPITRCIICVLSYPPTRSSLSLINQSIYLSTRTV
mmetsp:Transcript_45263/g.110250  ORF Transcript_45263/g.110250 Transcript_45263/m.110250 type:complete len:146 (-) Transcript_45263:16-453(-)